MAESIARSIAHQHSALLNTIVHDDVIISPPGPLKFSCFFIFAVADLSTKTTKFCTMRKFQLCGICCPYTVLLEQ